MQTRSDTSSALVAVSSRYGSRLVRDVLIRAGVRRVDEVEDGAEALTALAERKPAVLVLDWTLPVIGAREILAAARDEARSHAPAMPIIVTMPEPTRSAVDAALLFRVDSILAAPFSPGEFRRRLQQATAPR